MAKVAARRIELCMDHGAALCLGVAVAFAAFATFGPIVLLAGIPTYWLALRGLRQVGGSTLPARPIDPVQVRAPEPPQAPERVVRPFKPVIVPADPSRLPPPDASQALHNALNDLRRSLR